ncbi:MULTISPECIES: NAD(P)H-dependent glycerol-3-phosphate dehydrogenase [Elizabethkingia]|jgi:glycerol-3-phosphate dehydrogenase (NAD(P)+)|uniref:Glycerol-3-phosphate dehydrogenase n=1 Tax=Elizabethkingia ursingii TaxID=1756150 RepID=A0AAJ3TP63_9FLAO|nr:MULTISPECIES: NAD(P)H-dependent glycerol-3-phosphate dehydrogenase [Elizabethkingia]MDR2228885.1 NAD(P)-binding domain-containing protein [Flavobacteriaceae bacterium]AQX09909.1 glycerol-3-phosphate dehydrogenase [Elizabethkingia ursingii]MCL1664190.1 NAD(P)-binding domain-containing protein [Elizabethkingia ursingii]MCL1668955.1 NAD(P)-binding domain-containing protein [Elizabethkingia ursingii]MCL1672522.1 NAD(P)-binding domain-containing protein [Elizabethkingia ursingii]
MAKKKSGNGISVGVVGSGSFATAIVKMLTENCKTIHWCVRNEFVKGAIELKKHNPSYLTAVLFNLKQLQITTDINELVSACDVIILATPSIYLGKTLAPLNVDLQGKLFVSAIKGIVPEQNDIVAHFLREKYNIGFRSQAVISGPCHAEEVAMERLSYLTVSAADQDNALKVAKLLESDFIKVSQSSDILGNEYSAVLKNIYAIGAGIAAGLGYGDNFNAVYVSNAIREMELYLDAIYPEPRDVNQSAFLGDLLVTAYSLFSRNRMLGNLIGKGYTVKSAIQSMSMVAEGYYATKSIYEIGKEKKLKLPIVNTVYEILYEEKNAEKQFKKLTAKLN